MSFFITGTDTNVGKTVACSWLMLHYNFDYWKPIQSGTQELDLDTVKNLTSFPKKKFINSTYILKEPLSPHEAAKRENIVIDLNRINKPTHNNLIVEGAGGLYVPLNSTHFMIDLIEKLKLPIILVCRSSLGTINHTLLSLKLIKDKKLPLAGLIINGKKTPHNTDALVKFTNVPLLAEIDYLNPLNKKQLLSINPKFRLI